MQEIEGYKVEINYMSGPNWIIKIETPDKVKFITQVQVNGQINESQAYEYFKNKGKEFIIDL